LLNAPPHHAMPEYEAFRNQYSLMGRSQISSQQFQPFSEKLDSVFLHLLQIEFSEGDAR